MVNLRNIIIFCGIICIMKIPPTLRTIFFFLCIFLSANYANAGDVEDWQFETGDIIGQTSVSGQGPLVQMGTFSRYSHVGIVVMRKNKPYVLEATSTVRYTPLQKFVDKGKDKKYTVLRYHVKEQEGLTPPQKKQMIRKARKYMGKKYDLAFKWSDRKMYCSELVWKLYNDIGLTVSKQNTMKGFNLWVPQLRKVMEKRWGGKINMDEIVVAPSDIMRSRNVKRVYSNYIFK